MKKNRIVLRGRLFLNKEIISSLSVEKQQQVRGGNLHQAPESFAVNDRCTTIENFRYSYELPCAETVTSGYTGEYCITNTCTNPPVNFG